MTKRSELFVLFVSNIRNQTIKEKVIRAKRNGAQTVEAIAGRNVVVSAGVGKTNVEEIKWLTETVLAEASAWKSGWAYIADCSEMDPVTPAEGSELVIMTQKFVEAGCKAIGFAEGHSIMLKVQAQKNTQMSETGIAEGHFTTVEDALTWLKKDLGI